MTKSVDYDDTESSITSVSEAAAKRRQKEIRMRMNGAYPGSWPFNPIILILLVQGGAGGLAVGWVDLDLECSTILLGQ